MSEDPAGQDPLVDLAQQLAQDPTLTELVEKLGEADDDQALAEHLSQRVAIYITMEQLEELCRSWWHIGDHQCEHGYEYMGTLLQKLYEFGVLVANAQRAQRGLGELEA